MRQIFVVLLLLSGTWVSTGQIPKISSFVTEDLARRGSTDVLVYFNDKADLKGAELIRDRTARIRYVYDKLRATAYISQARFHYLNQSIVNRIQSFYIVNAVAVKNATVEEVKAFASMPEVRFVAGNPEVALDLPKQPRSSLKKDIVENVLPNLTYVGAEQVWNELDVRGEGIVIAVQDTGVDWTHEALQAQYRGNNGVSVSHDYNWHDAIRDSAEKTPVCQNSSAEPCDDHGHGTHVTGTVIGEYGNGNIIGVAPRAEWIGCRNMDHGVGTPVTYLECFEFFLAPYPRGGNPQMDGDPRKAPHVINNSWGCPKSEGCEGNEFVEAIESLNTAGILVVASAGNEGSACGSVGNAPGFYSGLVLSVGALDHSTGRITGFSSRGPSRWDGSLAPNISAPGYMIRSAIPGNRYASMSGTSMASPHVVGVVALLWSAKPELVGQIEATRDLIFRTAQPKTANQTCGKFGGGQIPNAVYGYGSINAYRAISE